SRHPTPPSFPTRRSSDLAMNRDGDNLSDLVMQMFGTIAGAESTLLAFDDAGEVTVAMSEAPHGTAPALEGKDVANPMAMILAARSEEHTSELQSPCNLVC